VFSPQQDLDATRVCAAAPPPAFAARGMAGPWVHRVGTESSTIIYCSRRQRHARLLSSARRAPIVALLFP
jgi:hypothetical protein